MFLGVDDFCEGFGTGFEGVTFTSLFGFNEGGNLLRLLGFSYEIMSIDVHLMFDAFFVPCHCVFSYLTFTNCTF